MIHYPSKPPIRPPIEPKFDPEPPAAGPWARKKGKSGKVRWARDEGLLIERSQTLLVGAGSEGLDRGVCGWV